MTNQQCRLIATAIVVLAGGLTLSLGLIGRSTSNVYGSGGEVLGSIMLLVGTVMFLVDYAKSWRDKEGD